MHSGRIKLFGSLILAIALTLINSPFAHSVEFGQDATGDPNAIHIQGNASGFLYSERIILTAAHVLTQLWIQPNGDTDGFVYLPGIADKTTAKRYRIVKALIPKTYVRADPSKNIQPIDDFAILVINEDIPLRVKVEIASEDQMNRFARENKIVKMVGYGLQSGNQRNNPQEEKRAPHMLTGTLYSPEMMKTHYNQYQGRPSFWNVIEWGVNSNQKTGTPCSGDSGSGFFVEENDLRYYVGTAGNGNGGSNCKADGTYSLSPGGAMSWFPSPNKFLDLLKSAETFVEEQKKKELAIVEDVPINPEPRASQESEISAQTTTVDKREAEVIVTVPKKIVITCIKGKSVKKLSSTKSVCPKGFKKK